ncbi:MAG TPA: hypothetical protein VGE86_00705 [Thermoanaerobaculia bacterium]
MDDRIRQLLKELGDAINESISESLDVNDRIQKIRDEGYNLYVVLDATIGLNREEGADATAGAGQQPERSVALTKSTRGDAQFRIDISDLGFLRSIGIDPTRKVRSQRRLEGRTNPPESS